MQNQCTNEGESAMIVWRRVSGLLSIVLYFFVMFRSIGCMLAENGRISGGAGMAVAVLMLAGGIISVKSGTRGRKGKIALIAVYGGAALIGFGFAVIAPGLCLWAVWCLFCSGLAVMSLIEEEKGGKGI